ncbi:TOG array regulator of axonemal microtubules protein 2-like [Lepisosteus oculatus]|uniref:TOG array regulator of axonemal microtubules protein 2-like n=1 Tax=Lepisosteus oculatus TaxID=7918 RepID=UPI0035F53009
MRWRVSPEGDSAPVLESSLPPPRVPEQSADAAGTLRAVAMPTEEEQQAEEDAVSVTAGAGNPSLALPGAAPAVSAGHVGSSLSSETAVDTTHTGPSSQQQTAQPGSDTHSRPCSPPHTGRSVEAAPAGGALLEVPAPLSKSARKKVRERWRKELDRRRRQKQEEHSEGGCGPGSGPSETPAALAESSTASTLVPAHSPPGEPPLRAPRPTRRASVAVLRPHHCPSLSSPRRRHSSVLPGSRLFQMSQETGGDSDAEEPRPLSNPELHLTQALRDLQREDWELKTQSLSALRALAAWHPDALRTRLHQVTELVSREVLSLRSGVSRAAMRALGAVCGALGSAMDGELEVVMPALLLRAGDSSEFLREGAQGALRAAVGSASPARALGSLISTGASHRNPASRCCAAEMMALVLEREGAEPALAAGGAGQEQLLLALVRLAQDAQQDTRFYGRRMLSLLISHPEFDLLAQRFLSTHDLHFLSTSFQQQVTRGSAAEPPWARGHRSPRVSVTTNVLSSAAGQGPGEQLLPGPRLRAAVLRSLQRGERLTELQALLTAQGHAPRARGIALLLELCTQHPLLVTANISKVWDWFGPRLQDPNRKVCLQALDMASQITPLLGNSLNPLLSHLATAAVDNLNAKHPGTAPAAATLLDCLISHCDNALLLQPLASRVQYSSGRAIQEVTERLAVLVRSLARLKPSAVERHALPALWHLIGQLTSGGAGGGRAWRGALGRLARGLQDTLPDRLQASAESRPPAQRDTLQEILGSPVEGPCPQRDEGAGGDREDRTSGDEREDGHGPAGQMEETVG